jgi:uncharacterized protein
MRTSAFHTSVLTAFGAVLIAAVVVAAPLVALTDYVVDQAGLIPADRETQLIEKLRAHEAATSNQVAIATVASLDGEVLEQAALEILRTAKLGQADRNNGVLLFIALAERKIRIEVGYGLEGALTDGRAGEIIRQRISPSFKGGNPAGGIEAGVDAIIAVIKGEYQPLAASPESDDGLNAVMPIIIFGGYILILLFILWRRKQRRAERRARGYGDDDDHWGSGGGFGGGGYSSGGGFSSGGDGFGGSGGGGGASGGW